MKCVDSILCSRTLGMYKIQADEAMLTNLVGTLGLQWATEEEACWVEKKAAS